MGKNKTPIHTDIIGNLVKVGDTVVAPFGTNSYLCKVDKLTPKMVIVTPMSQKGSTRRYPNDIIVVTDNAKLMLHLLYNKT